MKLRINTGINNKRFITDKVTENLITLLVFVAAFSVYFATMCPTLYWGDCGELASAAYNLSIAHPTGYPLWCLIGKLWTLILPVGTIVWRLNAMSAFFGALAVACLFKFCRYVKLPRSISVFVSGIVAFSFTFWQQCLFCETYSMTAFYTCLLLMLAAKWKFNGMQWKDMRWLAVGYGFAMTNHQLNTLFLPGFIGFILLSSPTLRRFKDRSIALNWLKTLLLGMLPLLFYLYLPIRSAAKPPMSWGYPTTPFEIYYHITGRNYANLMFQGTFSNALSALWAWALGLNREIYLVVVIVSCIGLTKLLMKNENRPLGFLLFWIIFADVFYAINYYIYNRYIYYIPGYITLSALAGIGVYGIWNRLQVHIDAEKRKRALIFASISLMIIVPAQLMRHWSVNNLSTNWACYDYACNLLKTMPENSIIIDNGVDTSAFTIQYLQTVEKYRTDVTLIRRRTLSGIYNPFYRQYSNAWYLKDLMKSDKQIASLFSNVILNPDSCLSEEPLRMIVNDAVSKNRPVFVTDPSRYPPIIYTDGKKQSLTGYMQTQGKLVHIGLLHRLYGTKNIPSDQDLIVEMQRVWSSYTLRNVYNGIYLNDDFLTGIALDYADGDLERGRLALRLGNYDIAEIAFNNVLHLFQSNEAIEGLRKCKEAKEHIKHKEDNPSIIMPAMSVYDSEGYWFICFYPTTGLDAGLTTISLTRNKS